MNMAGEIHLHSAGDKLPESTGENDSNLEGKLFQTALGKWLHWGYLVFRRGTFLYSVEEY